jgi:hypothetical protein
VSGGLWGVMVFISFVESCVWRLIKVSLFNRLGVCDTHCASWMSNEEDTYHLPMGVISLVHANHKIITQLHFNSPLLVRIQLFLCDFGVVREGEKSLFLYTGLICISQKFSTPLIWCSIARECWIFGYGTYWRDRRMRLDFFICVLFHCSWTLRNC